MSNLTEEQESEETDDLLERLAEEAHQEYLAGLTEPLDPEEL